MKLSARSQELLSRRSRDDVFGRAEMVAGDCVVSLRAIVIAKTLQAGAFEAQLLAAGDPLQTNALGKLPGPRNT